MHLMRIGPAGAEKPVVRLDDRTYVDVSDVVFDFNETFFGAGGLDRLRELVDERIAGGAASSSPASASARRSRDRTRSCASA